MAEGDAPAAGAPQTWEFTVGGQTQKWELDPGTTPEQAAAFGKSIGADTGGGDGEAPAAPARTAWAPFEVPTSPTGATWEERAVDYPLRRTAEAYNALGRLGGDVEDLWQKGAVQRSGWDVASDVASGIGTPVALAAAPEITLLGMGAGAAGQTYSPTAGAAADAAVNLVGGGVQAVKAYQDWQAANALKAGIGEFTRGTEPAEIGLSGAKAYRDQVDRLAKDVAGSTFEPTADYAAANGLSMDAGVQATLPQRLQQLADYHGAAMSDAEKDVITNLQTRMQSTQQPASGLVNAQGQPLPAPPATPATPLTYGELDDAVRQIDSAGVGRQSSLRGLLSDELDQMVQGTPVEGLRAEGKQRWLNEVIPQQDLAKTVSDQALMKQSYGAFHAMGGAGNIKDPDTLRLVQTALEPGDPQAWAEHVQGWYQDRFRNATPQSLQKKWNATPPATRAIVDPEGNFNNFVENIAGRAKNAWPTRIASGIVNPAIWGAAAMKLVHGDFRDGMLLLMGESFAGKAIKQGANAIRFGLQGAPALGRTGLNLGAIGAVAPWNVDQPPAPDEDRDLDQYTPPPANAPNEPPPTTEAKPAETGPPPGPTASAQPAQNDRDRIADVVGVPRVLAKVVMAQESGGNPNAVNPESGATGSMQLMPATFRKHEAEIRRLTGRDTTNIHDPIDNQVAGMLELREALLATGGNARQAAHYYYGGPNQRAWGPRTAQYGEDIVNRLRAEAARSA